MSASIYRQPFHTFTAHFWEFFFDNIVPMRYKNKLRESYFSGLEDYETRLHVLYIKVTL